MQFYKTITKWFSVEDTVIHALGMLLDFWKAKKTRTFGSCLIRFPKVSQHPACIPYIVNIN